ncbi:tyrosine-type recombinase/integrase [Oleidesulfovibrio alaskensis]
MPYHEGKKWRGVVRFVLTDGQLHRQTRLFDKKKDAIGWERDTRIALEHAEAQKRSLRGIGGVMTVGKWAEYYVDHTEQTWPHKTFDEKRRAFRRFFDTKIRKPGDPITTVSVEKASKVLAVLKEHHSGNNLNRMRKNLIAAWNWGIKNHKIPAQNPFALTDRSSEIIKLRYVPPMEALKAVVDVAAGEQRLMLLTAFYTAARKCELFRLRWTDVDFASNKIGLWTKKRKGGNLELDLMPMAKPLRSLLEEHHRGAESEHVFDQSPYSQNSNNRWLKELCKEAGGKAFGSHGIRHLAASYGIESGASIVDVQELLRHKSANVTARYIRRLKKGNRAVEALEMAL